MHQRSHSDLQGVSTQQGASTRWTTQDRASRSFRLRRGTGRLHLCPGRGAPLCVWLLLGSLALPGAWSFLSEEQEELLVELHNHYRGQVSPSAAAMMPLKWDPGLKLLAESYAAKCVWNHNPELEDTGENLYAGTGALDLRVALEKWFLEHLDYEFQNNSCDEDKMCGHYTQMVWADTHKVGCAFHLCNSMEGLDWERVSFLVCNYYPAGNYEDERPYVEGDWCSRCPENLQKCENNLCVADTVEEEEEEEEEGEIVVVQTPEISGEPEEEEQVDSAPTTADVQSATTTPLSTTSTPSTTTTTTSKPFVQDSEDDTPPATPTIGTHPATGDEKAEEKVEEEEEEEEEEEVGKETVDKTEGEHKLDIITYQSKEDTKSSASASSPSILLAAVTVTLTLRL